MHIQINFSFDGIQSRQIFELLFNCNEQRTFDYLSSSNGEWDGWIGRTGNGKLNMVQTTNIADDFQ